MKNDSFQLLLSQHEYVECVCFACISYLPCSADFAWPPHIFDIKYTIFDCMQLNFPGARTISIRLGVVNMTYE